MADKPPVAPATGGQAARGPRAARGAPALRTGSDEAGVSVPEVRLGPILGVDDESLSDGPVPHGPSVGEDQEGPGFQFVPVAPAPQVTFRPLPPEAPDRSASLRLETRLASLQRQVEWLAQAQSTQQTTELERATQLLQQMQTMNQLQSLERQMQQWQQPQPGGPGVPPPPAPPRPDRQRPAGPEDPADPFEDPPAPSASGRGRKPVMEVTPTETGSERFSLALQHAEAAEVLDMLGQLAGLNILVGKGVTGTVSASLQDVTVEEALQAILRSLGYEFEREGRFIFVMTPQEAEARKNVKRKLVTKIYRPNYISARDLETLVTPLLTKEVSRVAVTNPAERGLMPDMEDVGGDTQSQRDALLVQDYAEVIQEIDAVFAEMDVPPMQVVIEAMILSVRLTEAMQFGVNFALLNGSGKALFVSGDGAAVNRTAGFPGVAATIPLPPAAGSPFTDLPTGLKFGFIQGDMSAFVQALESISDTNLIAAPQLRVLNKQRAELIIGERIGYSTTVFQNNQAIQNVQFLDSGTRLILRPYISGDGLVRMEVHPERSSATISPDTSLPNLETTEVTTNIMVRDGQTAVIGGLIVNETIQSFDRIPVLGAMPVVGSVFRNKAERLQRSELIVLITPRIVREAEEALAADMARYESERRALEFQDRLTPVNRRNLARFHYDSALRHYERGELTRAAHHVNESLRQDKHSLEAIHLRDQIEAAKGDLGRRWFGLRPSSAGHR